MTRVDPVEVLAVHERLDALVETFPPLTMTPSGELVETMSQYLVTIGMATGRRSTVRGRVVSSAQFPRLRGSVSPSLDRSGFILIDRSFPEDVISKSTFGARVSLPLETSAPGVLLSRMFAAVR